MAGPVPRAPHLPLSSSLLHLASHPPGLSPLLKTPSGVNVCLGLDLCFTLFVGKVGGREEKGGPEKGRAKRRRKHTRTHAHLRHIHTAAD